MGLWIAAGLLSVLLPAGPALGETSEFDIEADEIFEIAKEQESSAAAGHPRALMESPASVTVISREQILESGASSIPELLRTVAGINVVRASGSDWGVTARDGIGLPAAGMLTLIDGRTIYTDFFSVVLWQALPVSIQEVDHIEIVKSPNTVLWGANASNGLINIVTRTPKQIKATEVYSHAGELSTTESSIIHGNSWRKWDFKLSAGYESENHFENDLFGGRKTSEHSDSAHRLNLQVNRDQLGPGALALSLGLTQVKGETMSQVGRFERPGFSGYTMAEYAWEGWQFHTYYNGGLTSLKGTGLPATSLKTHTWDARLQNSFSPFSGHRFTWGSSFRYNYAQAGRFFHGVFDTLYTPESPELKSAMSALSLALAANITGSFKIPVVPGFSQDPSGDREQTRQAFFLEDEFRLLRDVQMTLGGRYDSFSSGQDFISGNAALVWTPTENHALRASAGRSFNMPSLIDLYLNTVATAKVSEFGAQAGDLHKLIENQVALDPFFGPIGLAPQVADILLGLQIPTRVEGNPGNNLTRVESAELGYRTTVIPMIELSLDGWVKKKKRQLIYKTSKYLSPRNEIGMEVAGALAFQGSLGALLTALGSDPATLDALDGIFPHRIEILNEGEELVWGGETSLTFFPRKALSFFANYSLQRHSGDTYGLLGPKHKVNFGGNGKIKKLGLGGSVQYVGPRYYTGFGSILVPSQVNLTDKLAAGRYDFSPVRLDEYYNVVVQASYRFSDSATASLMVDNLLNHRRREYIDTDLLRRKIFAAFSLQF